MERLVELPESLLCELLRKFDTPELLALACTCRKLNEFVGAHVLEPGSEEYRKTKEAFLRQKLNRQRKAQRKANILECEIQDVNREMRTLKEEANELRNQERVDRKLYQEIGRGRSAGIALKTWAPAPVSVWHKKVVEQTPVSVDSRMEDLAAKLKVTKLLLKNVLQRMETKKRKLSVLEESLSSLKRTTPKM